MNNIPSLQQLIGDLDLLKQQQQPYALNLQNQFGFSTIGQSINTINAGLGIAGSLMNLYSGLKALDMADEQLDMQKEQFEEAKKELEYKRSIRSSLNARW